ncbi:MAG TPA: hypothetical protein VEW67_04805 [Thermoleophilaceae bacterium]|nr:hypothetical protein [Thermoleophilaceae bacterium]
MPEDKPLKVGDIWHLTYEDHPEPDPPHVEDVLVAGGERVDHLGPAELRDHLMAEIAPWDGGPETIFDGTVAGTPSGRIYVPEGGPLPTRSTGYWLPDRDLVKRVAFGKIRFLYTGPSELDEFTWAGVAEPPQDIEASTLVRVSLARWYSPSSAPAGYYVQISGIY